MLAGNPRGISMGGIKKPEASIVILTLNAGDEFKKTLKGIYSQSFNNFEVIIIDSSSTDNTLEIAKKYPVKIHKIKREDFGHGKTRNLGANLAKGKYVVFLTQDAIPADKYWLSELISSFDNKKVVGAFSRQLAKKEEHIIDKSFHINLYPNKDKLWSWNNFYPGENVFSDVSSIIKKDFLLKHPFDEKIIVTEDYEWANRILKKGYLLFYNSKSKVIHSHSYTIKQLFKRNFDIGVSYLSVYNSSDKSKGLFKRGLKIMSNELIILIKNGKVYLVPLAIFRDMIKYLAITLGKISPNLPNKINEKFSNYPRYWK